MSLILKYMKLVAAQLHLGKSTSAFITMIADTIRAVWFPTGRSESREYTSFAAFNSKCSANSVKKIIDGEKGASGRDTEIGRGKSRTRAEDELGGVTSKPSRNNGSLAVSPSLSLSPFPFSLKRPFLESSATCGYRRDTLLQPDCFPKGASSSRFIYVPILWRDVTDICLAIIR